MTRIRKWFNTVFHPRIWGGLLIACLVFVAGSYAAIVIAGNMLMDESDTVMSETTVIYNHNDKSMAKLYDQNRDAIDLKDMSPYLFDAFVATEDARFYQHNGVDVKGVIRALFVNITAGEVVQGGSTITQQLAKNTYLTHDQTMLRKVKEAVIALNLERRYKKEEIMQKYLNRIFFGHTVYGVEAASEFYFGKNAKDLQLAEAALLAGLPKAPNTYSPFQNKAKAKERRNLVLSLMLKNINRLKSDISEEDIRQAMQQPIQVRNPGEDTNEHRAYVDYVIQEAEQRYGLSMKTLQRKGYHIYTFMEPSLQQAMHERYQNPDYFPQDGPEHIVESGMVIMDHQTGGIAGLIGGRRYQPTGLHRALIQRQPGSTFKPLAVYAPALKAGWHPYDRMVDERITYNDEYTPENYDGRYRGRVLMWDAVRMSYNAPAVWLLNEIGMEASLSFLEASGFSLTERDRHLAIALGGLTNGVSPVRMAQAYTMFPRYGTMIQSHAIRKIVDANGQTIARAEPETKSLMSKQNAYHLHRMLESVVQNGTGTQARIRHPVAGKTGTTKMEKVPGANKDAWFVGYTPRYVGAVWMGFDQPDQQHVLKGGSNRAADLFGSVMQKALQEREILSFKKPEGIDRLPPPVRFEKIQDLRIDLQLDDNLQMNARLTWSANSDDRVRYRIYRFKEDPNNREQIGETNRTQWTLNLQQEREYRFVVTPYDPVSERVGPLSNTVTPQNRSWFDTIWDDFFENGESEEQERPDQEKPQEES